MKNNKTFKKFNQFSKKWSGIKKNFVAKNGENNKRKQKNIKKHMAESKIIK